MDKYKAYPEYKDSGVQWLGDIPQHWMAVRYKFCTKRVVVGIAEAATHAYADYGVPILRSTNVRENKLDTRGVLYIQDFFAKQNTSKFLFKNDIITVRTGFPGVSAVIPQCFDKSQCFTNLISTPRENYSPEFLSYCLNSSLGKSYFELSGWGSAQKNISVPILQDFPLALPLRNEQLKIVNFITHETVKIDNLIEKQQQLIELLKEKRQAVISHAVTKGLNPDVPMKDSGVEWLGKVPEHWGVMPVKYVCALIKDGTHLPPPRVDNGIPLLSVRNIIGGVFQFRDDDSQISHNDYKSLCSSFIPQKDDVLLAIVGATLGKVALVPEMDSFHIQRSLGVFRTNTLINPQHLSYIFESKDFQNLLWENAGFSAQPGIYLGTLSNFCIPVPPVTEQFKISEIITATVDKLDILISQASQLIGLMQERRTALISAAVTGKIDVRDWVAPDTQGVEESQEATA